MTITTLNVIESLGRSNTKCRVYFRINHFLNYLFLETEFNIHQQDKEEWSIWSQYWNVQWVGCFAVKLSFCMQLWVAWLYAYWYSAIVLVCFSALYCVVNSWKECSARGQKISWNQYWTNKWWSQKISVIVGVPLYCKDERSIHFPISVIIRNSFLPFPYGVAIYCVFLIFQIKFQPFFSYNIPFKI